MFYNKAQISTEAIISMSLLLLLLLMILLFVANMRMQSDIMNEKSESTKECYSLAALLSKANAQNYSEITFMLNKDVFISGNKIKIGEVSCNFFGTMPDTSIVAGNVEITKKSILEVKNV